MAVRRVWLIWVLLFLPGWSAPLVGGDHEGQDAVRYLRELGVLEGYPDGGFRGERATSRWEVAAILARVLARAESSHQTLATRVELEELHRLALAYREELDALGVRVTSLEEQVERLDQRVAEKGRITFSGRSVTYIGGQSFSNRGNPTSGFGPGALDYHAAVGSLASANLLPHSPLGIVPAIDLMRGQPLTNGSGFASLLFLTTTIVPNDDFTAELQLYAYSSQGDQLVDALWGITPPYLSNSFTGTNFANGQSLNNVPFTRAGFDRFTLSHHPSGITATVGTFTPRVMTPTVYLGQINPIKRTPNVLESFGFQITQDSEPWAWEVFGTRNPSGNPGVNANPYRNEALGAAVSYSGEQFRVGFNFLRAADQFTGGGPLTVGQQTQLQGLIGELYTEWVNPPGFYLNELGGIGSSQVAGVGSTSDQRPVPGDPTSDALSRLASVGPQGITLWGLNFQYNGDDWEVRGDYATSTYKPNRNSAYSVDGDLWNLGARKTFDDGNIELAVNYRSTDPTYDPLILSWPDAAASGLNGMQPLRAYHRVPDFDNYWHLYALHDTNKNPLNRRGWWLDARWQYSDEGWLKAHYNTLEQVKTSLPGVRVLANSLAPGTPNATVLGHVPGFLDPVFRAYSPMSFDAALNPLEDQRGKVTSYGGRIVHDFADSPWGVDFGYDRWHFDRPTTLPAALGGSQNRVDLLLSTLDLGVSYRFTSDLKLKVGVEQGRQSGHYDSFGTYNPYALAANSVDFKTRDTVQTIPYAKVDWSVDPAVKINSEIYFYNTVDHVGANIFSGPPNGGAATNHPFSWKGIRYGTTVEVTF